MSDLGTPGTTTVTCPSCGHQADATSSECERCGAVLTATSAGVDGEGLELIEAERAAAADGFDDDARVDDRGRAECPKCGAPNEVSGLAGSGRATHDTATNRQDLELLTFHCGGCEAALRVVIDRTAENATGSGDETGSGGPQTSTSDSLSEPTPGARPEAESADRPVSDASSSDEADRLEPTGPGSLRDQGSLLDEDGDDIRMYSGEPVETDEGWVLPVQQNFAGRDNIAGGGEWPDPNAEPAQPRPADADQVESAPFTPSTRSTDGDAEGNGDRDTVVPAEDGPSETGQDLPGRN